jgi:tetratricopeptide (TPR) repeat protein
MSGLCPDALTRLLRQGRIKGQKVGHTWEIDPQSLYAVFIASWRPDEVAQQTTHLLNYVSTHYADREQYDTAEALMRDLLAATEDRFGREHLNTLPILAALAQVCFRPGRYDEATALSQHLLALQEREVGSDHPVLIDTLKHLAQIALEEGDYREAEQYSLRALGIAEHLPEQEHPTTAALLDDLAWICLRQDQHTQAASLLKRAIAIDERVLGPEHPKTIKLRCNLARLYVDVGDSVQAGPLYERILQGHHHPPTYYLEDLKEPSRYENTPLILSSSLQPNCVMNCSNSP